MIKPKQTINFRGGFRVAARQLYFSICRRAIARKSGKPNADSSAEDDSEAHPTNRPTGLAV